MPLPKRQPHARERAFEVGGDLLDAAGGGGGGGGGSDAARARGAPSACLYRNDSRTLESERSRSAETFSTPPVGEGQRTSTVGSPSAAPGPPESDMRPP